MNKYKGQNTFIFGIVMLLYNDFYRIAMFGHRNFYAYRQLDNTLYPLLKELFRTKPFVEIYIGRDGEFDLYAASIVKHVQEEMGRENSELNLVLPYTKKDMEYYEKYYDRVCVPINAHPKVAIPRRNEWMVEQADLVLCYIERESGGAYKAVQYAKKLGKEIINLTEGIGKI